MSESVTIAVMAFNEVDTLEGVVEEIVSLFDGLSHPFTILIVDDGSTDGTSELSDRLAEEQSRVRVVHHSTNLGLGEVYRSAFREADGAWLTFLPADGQIPADCLPAFLEQMSGADLVLGYIPDRRVSLWVKALSRGERMLYQLLFGGFPRFQGAFMFRRSILDEITLVSKGRGWTIVMELVLRICRGDYVIKDAPTGLRPRTMGVSKVNNLSNIWSNLKQAVVLRRSL